MLNLWSDVTEGTFGTAGSEGVSANVSAEIESAVTEDPVSMVEYVGSCTEGMIAVEAALAMAEGRSVAKYLTATDESAKAELKTAMEGVLADAWDKIKDYAERAYEAIKKFIKKVWNKMKGYYGVVKAMMTKYGKVIGSKDTSGLKVSWVKVTLTSDFASEIERKANAILSQGVENASGGSDNANYKDLIRQKLYQGGDDEAHPEAFTGDIKKQAIRVADGGFDWMYMDLFKLCDKSERDIIKRLNDAKKQKIRATDSGTASDEDKQNSKDYINRCSRQAIQLIRMASVMAHTAANTLYSQSVRACRKAIRYNAGDKSASEESTDFSALMATVL